MEEWVMGGGFWVYVIDDLDLELKSKIKKSAGVSQIVHPPVEGVAEGGVGWPVHLQVLPDQLTLV